jgi:hypothetical protein
MTVTLLHESGAAALKREGSTWMATLITPGTGSSGKYAEDMLARDSSEAFPAGTKLFFKHPEESQSQRDPRDQWGYLGESAALVPGIGTRGPVKVLPHWQPVVDALAEAGQAALSIYAMGESDAEGNITRLLPDVQNSIDMVAYPGRPGSGLTEKMFESARAAAPQNRTEIPSGEGKKETKMTPEQEALLREALTAFQAFVTESKAAADARAQESVDEKAAKLAEDTRVEATIVALEAVNKADLPDALRENLVSVVKAGNTDVDKMIENAVKLHASVKAEVEAKLPAPTGFFSESSATLSEEAKEFEALFGGGK